MTEKAYAKINLFLDVLSKRADGFHDIRTVMQTVSLCDILDVTSVPAESTKIYLKTDNPSLPCDEGNLAFRAAELYLKAAELSAEVHIKIEKHIPIAAGLAGGSSDAAAVLRAMNAIFDAQSTEQLLELASSLGSDVPFCLVGGTRLCEGRGELMSELNTPAAHLVIAIGDEHISTPLAFARLDEKFSSFDGSVETGGEDTLVELLEGLKGGKIVYDKLFNIFETDIGKNAKSVSKIKAEMISRGASAAIMSGSGPSVVGFFQSEMAARDAQVYLSENGYFATYSKAV